LEQLITITLFGKPYNFKVESDATKAQEVAEFLVQEVAKVESQQPGKSSEIAKLAILISVALNIASEHIQLKKIHSDLLQKLAERSRVLIRALDTDVR
jgi:cell division protein ZapA (FtsZ GTPase activity inhibitor)